MKVLTSNATFAAVLTTCAATFAFSPVPAFAANENYVCDAIGDGNYVVRIPQNDRSIAIARYDLGGQGDELILRDAQTAGPPDFRYTGHNLEFFKTGNGVALEDLGADVVVNCTLQAATGGQN